MPNDPKDDPKQNPEHIGNVAAGHSRDEENRRRADKLAEQADADKENAGSINPDALKEEREILTHMNPFTAELEVSHKKEGRHYLWIISNSTIIASFNSMGYQPIKGDDKEAWEHRGQHKAAGSTLRGVGDCLLYWIPEERYQLIEEHYRRKADAMMGVEENWEQEANHGPNSPTRRFGPLAHGSPNDPLLRRTVLRGTRGQVERLNESIRTGEPLERSGVQVRG